MGIIVSSSNQEKLIDGFAFWIIGGRTNWFRIPKLIGNSINNRIIEKSISGRYYIDYQLYTIWFEKEEDFLLYTLIWG